MSACLKEFSSLHKVILMERQPRVDALSAVSDYSNFVIRLLAAKSEFKDNIVFGSHSLLECDTDAKMVNMFLPPVLRHPSEGPSWDAAPGIPDTNAWR